MSTPTPTRPRGDRESPPPRPSRRAVLGALAGSTLAGTAGCVSEVRALFTRDGPSQVSVAIETVPADADPRAMLVAQFLGEQLRTVGIAARVVPSGRENLYRDVLVNQEFDLYVGRMPPWDDPDYLRGLLHSRFAVEPGWQNPFGYADITVDRLLERQRRQAGQTRRRILARLQRAVVRSQPFSVVAVPDEIRAVRADSVLGWNGDLHTPLGYLALSPDNRTRQGGADGNRSMSVTGSAARTAPAATESDATATTTATESATETATPTPAVADAPEDQRSSERVRMALTDVRALKNLNPLAAPFRDQGVITGLLYDPLGRRIGGAVRPWLAESWRWLPAGADGTDWTAAGGRADVTAVVGSVHTPPSSVGPTLEVRLREGLEWHDGTPLTAEDVAFTYRFLQDTSLGSLDSAVPAPRFRGPVSLVTDATVVDDRTVRLELRESTPAVAMRALTVPVLPSHVWAEKATEATVAGIAVGGRTLTEALVWPNRTPVGSGPLQLRTLTVREMLSLEPFEDHFLGSTDDPHLRPYRGGVSFDRLTFQRAPSSGAAVSMVKRGDTDATANPVLPANIPAIGRDDAIQLHVDRSRGFYHVGFNTRRRPFGNPRFRRAVARLLDRQHLVETVFDGYASPAVSPLARHEALAPDLAWTGEAPALPFPGRNGRLDVQRARQVFREAGYRYSDDDRLLGS